MYYIYIIESEKDSTFYIGFSSNIEERIFEHNMGRTRYTKSKRPWKLRYVERFSTKTEALKRERSINKLKSHEYILRLIENQNKGP
ncbi:GIY-YIG nuclease family protein [Candidatus Roizmanbacteria bacterium]|nr:GIY-YIG nuclease family protein [Candidatus Roizmanbacteria bacterium]